MKVIEPKLTDTAKKIAENKYPILVIGSFIFNEKGELLLKASTSQNNKYTYVNEKVRWGERIEETLRRSVREKTNLIIKSYELIGLTDALNLKAGESSEIIHLIFADYKVNIKDSNNFKMESNQEYRWLTLDKWLQLDKNKFGPYIYEIIEKLTK